MQLFFSEIVGCDCSTTCGVSKVVSEVSAVGTFIETVSVLL